MVHNCYRSVGWLKVMASWFVRDRREAWKRRCLKLRGKDHLFCQDIWDLIECLDPTEAESAPVDQYNVHVYKVLPYPPNTKDVDDFFVRRS